jgi:LysM repeat protein
MNNPNPFVPQGSLLEQLNRSRARLRLAVFSVLTVPVICLVTLLITQGCKREQPQPLPESQPTPPPLGMTNPPTMEMTNPPTVVPTNPLPVVQAQVTPAGATEYTVVKNDNFSTIGKKFGVSAKAIQDANPNVNPLKLQPNQKIVIPAPAPAAGGVANGGGTLVAASGEQLYEVKSGDTLSSIAKQHGTTYKAIQAANNLSDTRIKVGQKLKIPVKASAPAETVPPALSNAPAPVAK